MLAKCGTPGGKDLCLEDNKCSKGHTGFLCQVCEEGYYRDFDGSCQQCMASPAVHVIVGWVLVVIVVLAIIYFLSHGYQQNKVSITFHLLKNLVNYIIIFSVLTEIFGKVWVQQSPKDHPIVSYFASSYVAAFRYIYRIPYRSIEIAQCAAWDDNTATAAGGTGKFDMVSSLTAKKVGSGTSSQASGASKTNSISYVEAHMTIWMIALSALLLFKFLIHVYQHGCSPKQSPWPGQSAA